MSLYWFASTRRWFFLAEWHNFLRPNSSREEAAGCVLTWLISSHATHREWEWDGGSAAGVWSDGTAGALPLKTKELTSRDSSSPCFSINRQCGGVSVLAHTAKQDAVVTHSQTPNLSCTSAQVTQSQLMTAQFSTDKCALEQKHEYNIIITQTIWFCCTFLLLDEWRLSLCLFYDWFPLLWFLL